MLQRAIWLETDRQYRAAAEALIKIKTSKEVQVQSAEEHAPDFSREKPEVSIGPACIVFNLTGVPGKKKFASTRHISGSPPMSRTPS